MLLYNFHNNDVPKIFRRILERNPNRGPGCNWLSSLSFPNRHRRLGSKYRAWPGWLLPVVRRRQRRLYPDAGRAEPDNHDIIRSGARDW